MRASSAATEVPAQFLELTDESDPRAATTGARHPTARAAVAAARGTSGGDVSSFMSSSMPGARDFWIGAATYRSSRAAPRVDDADAAAAAAAAAEPIPADERAALAEAFVARLLPALLAAHRVASRETTRRASLRLVTSALRRLTSTTTTLAPSDRAALLACLGVALGDGQSTGMTSLALQIVDILVAKDVDSARALRRHGILRRVETLANRAERRRRRREPRRRRRKAGRGTAETRADSESSVGSAEPSAGPGLPRRRRAGRNRRSPRRARRWHTPRRRRRAATAASAASTESLAATAAAISRGDARALATLADLLASSDGVTEYELDEARVAAALLHFWRIRRLRIWTRGARRLRTRSRASSRRRRRRRRRGATARSVGAEAKARIRTARRRPSPRCFVCCTRRWSSTSDFPCFATSRSDTARPGRERTAAAGRSASAPIAATPPRDSPRDSTFSRRRFV